MTSPASVEDRKRPLHHLSESDVSEAPRKKLHADFRSPIDSRDSTVDVEEDEDAEDLHPAYKGLEAFRKEAIYRKLLESRRDHARTRHSLRIMDRDLRRSERIAALFGRFWSQLVEDLASQVSAQDRQELLATRPPSLNSRLEEAEESLHAQSAALLPLLSRYITSKVDVSSETVQLQQRCHDLVDEVGKFKQELFLTQSKLERAEHSLLETNQKLSRVEKDYVRSQSELLNPNAGKAASKRSPDVSEDQEASAKPGTPSAVAEKDSTAQDKESAQESVNAEILEQLEKAKGDLATAEKESDQRYAEIKSFNEEIKALKFQVHQYELQLNDIPEDRIRRTVHYKELEGQITHIREDLKATRDRLEGMDAENQELRQELASYQKKVEVESRIRVDELEKLLKTKDADVTRLRGQRDELQAELTERRHREQVKFSQIEEMKALVNTKEERLAILDSQMKRLRLTIAALRGEQAAVNALKDANTEADQIEVLGKACKAAEDEVVELQAKLASLGAQAGANGSTSADAHAEREAELTSEVSRLKLALSASEASSTALCDEIDRLSTAYAELERQASTKVMDLSRIEEKNLRLVTEKSKADNKYFSAMRAKDSVELEKRAALRNVERQTKLIDLLTEGEKSFASQLKLHEKEVLTFRRAVEAHSRKIRELEAELKSSQLRYSDAIRSKAQADEAAKALIITANDEKDARKRTDERIVRLERELELSRKQAAKAQALGTKARKGSEATEEAEVQGLRALLLCSACKVGFRSKIITKCYHTFCAPCIDMRIQTRQRKCPHCGLSFANSDVQPYYMQ